jgi:hypothetical protein
MSALGFPCIFFRLLYLFFMLVFSLHHFETIFLGCCAKHEARRFSFSFLVQRQAMIDGITLHYLGVLGVFGFIHCICMDMVWCIALAGGRRWHSLALDGLVVA